MASLPADCLLRPAGAGDLGIIRRLVWTARLDPTQLRWQQFWVVEQAGEVIACGQLRTFHRAQELGSVVVQPQWRSRGIGSYLIEHLMRQATQPLYLECLGKRLTQFYTRFGFVPVDWSTLPPSLRWKFGLPMLAARFLGVPVTVMHRPAAEVD